MFSKWFAILRERLVYVLSVVVILLLGIIGWLLFQPAADDTEWRTVNQQMQGALNERQQSPSVDSSEKNKRPEQKPANKSEPSKDSNKAVLHSQVIELNSATLEQLDTLPGIGPAKAQAIIDLRTQLGGFRSVEQLLEVKGIGPKTLDKFRDRVKVTATR